MPYCPARVWRGFSFQETAEIEAANRGGLDPQSWPAKIVQRQFAKLVGIAHACDGKLDNLVRYSFMDWISCIYSDGRACPFESDAHGTLGFGIKSQAVQELADGHDSLPFHRRERK